MSTAILNAPKNIQIHPDAKKLIDEHSPHRVGSGYHIFEYDGAMMCCTLNQTNIIDNSNKFFIMQLLKHDKANSYCIYTRSGRVGYDGNWTCDLFVYIEDAIREYNRIFLEKTGKTWKDRYSKTIDFLNTKDNKYDFIEMKHQEILSEEELKKKYKEHETMKKKYTCEIDAQVQALVQLIYDPKLYDKTLQQLKIDSNRLPLGKLSLNQLDKAYQIIGYLSNNLEQLDSKQLIKLSSQFYTIIPYASGMSAPPLIDDVSKIEEKIEQLKALDEMIVAAEKMLNPKISNIDEKYFSLHCGLQTVTNSKELNMIVDYAKNTSASTHHFNIRVKNVFKVCRDGEDNRFDKFIGSPNRQLLWHGSRLANFVGILSKGLRINPSNVIKTGSMFGNGLYFSNTASKSAQYIYTKKNGIMLLCEVALGKTYELTKANYVTKLPDGCLSTHGMGMTAPDSKGYITMDDGVIVPMGKLVKKDIVSTLRYDEFIVYDIAQIRIRYLVQIDLI